MVVGAQVPLRVLRTTLNWGVRILREGVSAQGSTRIVKQVHALLTTRSSGQHYASHIKISSRWYSTSVRQFKNPSGDTLPRISVRAAVSAPAASSPFGCTLRPRLVGGAMPRRAGGYSVGGSVRYFSHTPAAPAKVLSQISRAFAFNGAHRADRHQRAGTDWLIGVRAELFTAMQSGGSGAYVDFNISPRLSYISTLESPELFESLNAGSRNLVAVTAELEKLGMLGNLTTTRPGPTGDILRVHFSGCSKGFVENICEELGVQEGIVHENEKFIFPGLPDYEPSESSVSSGSSTYSEYLYSDYPESSAELESMTFFGSPASSQPLVSSESSIELEPTTFFELLASSQTMASPDTSESSAFSTYLESSAYFEDDEDDEDGETEMDFHTIEEPEFQRDDEEDEEDEEDEAEMNFEEVEDEEDEGEMYFEEDEEDEEDKTEMDFNTIGDPEYQGDDDYPSDSESGAVSGAPGFRFNDPKSLTEIVVTSEADRLRNYHMRLELAIHTLDASIMTPSHNAYSGYLPGSDPGVVGVNSDSHSSLETLEGAIGMPEADRGSNHYANVRPGAAILTPNDSTGTLAQSDYSSDSEPGVIIDTPANSTETLEWGIHEESV